MILSSLLKLSEELLHSEYKENLILITFFLVCYFSCQKFFLKDNISKEEKLNRQNSAEEYLNKHKEDDNEFFYGAFSSDPDITLINHTAN